MSTIRALAKKRQWLESEAGQAWKREWGKLLQADDPEDPEDPDDDPEEPSTGGHASGSGALPSRPPPPPRARVAEPKPTSSPKRRRRTRGK